ncbi:MAG: hypothetical protein AAF655_04030 [Bacteroidota bacterium]
MKLLRSKYGPYVFLLLAGMGIMYGVMPHIFLSPNNYLLDVGIDGFRNYYAFAWYGRYDGGMMFTGMNYPYPQHLFFCEVIPGLSIPLSGLGQADSMIGVLHIFMILCFPLSVMLLYAILREWDIHPYFAVVAALLIGSLSPQLLRYSGHFSLSFLIFLPALLRLIQLEKRLQLSMYGWSAAWILLFTSFHGYYLMVGCSLLLGYWLVSLIHDQDRKQHIAAYLKKLGLILFPLLLVSLFLGLTDTVGDRPTHPYGYFAYQTRWEGLFLPAWGPIWEALNQLVEVRKVNMEARVYIGLVGTCTFLILLVRWVRNLIQKKGISYFPVGTPAQLKTWVQLSLLILLFSTAFPFSLGLRDLLDFLPILKQFRSLGRFGWIFFYVWSLFTTVVLYHFFRRLYTKRGPVVAYLVLGGIFLCWAWEGTTFLQERKLAISQVENPFRKDISTYQQILSENQSTPADFQSILPIPFYHIGSEKFSPKHIDNEVFRESLKASYELGIPMGTGFLPRSSLSQTLKILQLNSHPILEREILTELDQDKSILVMGKEMGIEFDPADLMYRGRKLADVHGVEMKALTVEELEPQYLGKATFIDASGWKPRQNGSWQANTYPLIIYQGFDGKIPQESIFGEETFSFQYGKEVIFNQELTPVNGFTLFHFSIWIKADLRRDAFPHIHLYLLDENGKEEEHTKLDPKYANDIYQDWVHVKHTFSLTSERNTLRVEVHGKFAEVESLLIRSGQDLRWEYQDGLSVFNTLPEYYANE